jgi:hypothetical protein
LSKNFYENVFNSQDNLKNFLKAKIPLFQKFVSENNDILKNNHVKHYPATLEVDKYIHKCSETAGILLGRTTIEGWMCGKSGWIYNVDSSGNIIDKKLYEVPSDVEKYYSSSVSKKIKDSYINILND